ncbi:MAG: SRPBCC family protein [Bacteroidetes bacterium]|nr:SRPBCC family protein [Bacteroidota bacterium]MBU1484788.1 SRPBCC family protein [Bacteroidota bacterium]MBU2267720.1 SRPBCC family protein [Bacteroidota bacterium]MBU2375600.1 SRPBCC family protein [Bacteroidota bacterium]
MKTHTLHFTQKMPISLTEAWDFFSSPLNLSKITPKRMSFVITSDYAADTKMYEGMLISYKVSPLLGIKMDWMTEITHVKEGEYFIDEQRFGPFALWHHEHHFKAIEGGVIMTDKLTYGVPFGFLGRIANSIMVAKQTQEIFDYRVKAVDDLFGIYK